MEMNIRKVAVYITTYNRVALLKRAIDSVLAQTIVPDEIFICDDGSTDGTREYLQSISSSRVKPIFNTPPNQGACAGRNAAIFSTNCEYITGLDDDDYFEPWRIEKFLGQVTLLESGDQSIAGLFDSVIEHRADGQYVWNETKIVDHRKLRHGNAVGNQVFTKTEYLREIQGFDKEMPALQDWDTWLRLTQKYGKLVNINSSSYIQIQNHGDVRISEKSSAKIRSAFTRLKSKLAPLTWSEKIDLLDSMYAYRQIDIKATELLYLAIGIKPRRVAQALKRNIIK